MSNETVLVVWHTTVVEEYRHDFTIEELSDLLSLTEAQVVTAINNGTIGDLIRQKPADDIRNASGADMDEPYIYLEETHRIEGIYAGAERPQDARV